MVQISACSSYFWRLISCLNSSIICCSSLAWNSCSFFTESAGHHLPLLLYFSVRICCCYLICFGLLRLFPVVYLVRFKTCRLELHLHVDWTSHHHLLFLRFSLTVDVSCCLLQHQPHLLRLHSSQPHLHRFYFRITLLLFCFPVGALVSFIFNW